MRVVGLVPSKLNSRRLERKNVRPLGGTPLVNHVLRTLSDVDEVDEIVVFASSGEIMTFVDATIECVFVERPEHLDDDAAAIEDVIEEFLTRVSGDVVVLLHITSPFISTSTVRACIDSVTSGRFQSAFAALEMARFAWFGGAPLNYDPSLPTPRTQDLEPVLVEQSGLYVFTRELFETTRRRVAERPYIHVVDPIEGHDIDTETELELAEAIAQARVCGAGS